MTSYTTSLDLTRVPRAMQKETDVGRFQAEVLPQPGQRLAGAGQALRSSRGQHRPDVPEDVDSAVGAERTRLLQEGKPVGERDDVWPSQQWRIGSMVIALEPQAGGQLDQGAQGVLPDVAGVVSPPPRQVFGDPPLGGRPQPRQVDDREVQASRWPNTRRSQVSQACSVSGEDTPRRQCATRDRSRSGVGDAPAPGGRRSGRPGFAVVRRKAAAAPPGASSGSRRSAAGGRRGPR
jgi:hypothetical protein